MDIRNIKLVSHRDNSYKPRPLRHFAFYEDAVSSYFASKTASSNTVPLCSPDYVLLPPPAARDNSQWYVSLAPLEYEQAQQPHFDVQQMVNRGVCHVVLATPLPPSPPACLPLPWNHVLHQHSRNRPRSVSIRVKGGGRC